MAFTERQAKGLTRCLVETGLDPEKLRIHISEIAPGTRSHPPHTHDAVEAFYVLEGHGAVEIGGERHDDRSQRGAHPGCRTLHGLENTGDTPMRYMVMMTPLHDAS